MSGPVDDPDATRAVGPPDPDATRYIPPDRGPESNHREECEGRQIPLFRVIRQLETFLEQRQYHRGKRFGIQVLEIAVSRRLRNYVEARAVRPGRNSDHLITAGAVESADDQKP